MKTIEQRKAEARQDLTLTQCDMGELCCDFFVKKHRETITELLQPKSCSNLVEAMEIVEQMTDGSTYLSQDDFFYKVNKRTILRLQQALAQHRKDAS